MDTAADGRSAFLAQQREISRQRYDRLHSLHYDELWGDVEPLHAAFLGRLVRRVRRGARVLDAACGTGKYWPLLIGGGLRVFGVDQSVGMLARARGKQPEVPTRMLALQDLAGADDLAGGFDAVVCIDAMEFIGPEDWPGVLAGFARVLHPGGLLYLTVEQPEHDGGDEPPGDPRQLPAESLEGGGYHHYPAADQVRGWLAAAGFEVVDAGEGDWYWHLLTRYTGHAGDTGPGR